MAKRLVLIPTYNERENITLIVSEIFEAHPDLFITVIDDNSPDGTGDVAEELKKKYPHLNVLHRPGKEGLGEAYKDGIRRALADPEVGRIITMDADGSHAVEFLAPLLKAGETHDLVIGSRYTKGGDAGSSAVHRSLLSLCANFYARTLTGLSVTDLTAGFMNFDADLLRRIDMNTVKASGYAFLTELKFLAVHKFQANYTEIPITLHLRREGESKMTWKVIREGLRLPWYLWWKRVTSNKPETFMLLGFFIAAFIGIWYALPMVNVVSDEMYYVGGVFRALAAHSLIPLPGDVPYGTLTFYLNYIVEIPFILLNFVEQGFNVAKLAAFLVLHPESAYIVTRFISAVLVCFAIYFYNRFLRKEGVPLLQRFAAILVPTATILPEVILHTGKMWVLSMILVTTSMLLLYRAITLRTTSSERGSSLGFWSIFTAWAAFANFPLPVIFLFNIPVLAYFYRHSRTALVKLAQGTLAGAALYIVVLLTNYKSVFSEIADVLTHYHQIIPTNAVLHISFLASVVLHSTQLLIGFPIVILLLVWALARRTIKNRTLFWVSLTYAVIYFVFVIFIATWYNDTHEYLRYLFPFGFFFSTMLVSFDGTRLRKVLTAFCVAQVIVGLYILYLLSVPSTGNLARNYVDAHFSNVPMVIFNSVSDLDLPENSTSATATADSFCGSKCAYLRTHPQATTFVPVILDEKTDFSKIASINTPYVAWVGTHALTSSCPNVLLTSFKVAAVDTDPINAEWGLGTYFDSSFWGRAHLGENIYVYQVAASCAISLVNTLPTISISSPTSQPS